MGPPSVVKSLTCTSREGKVGCVERYAGRLENQYFNIRLYDLSHIPTGILLILKLFWTKWYHVLSCSVHLLTPK